MKSLITCCSEIKKGRKKSWFLWIPGVKGQVMEVQLLICALVLSSSKACNIISALWWTLASPPRWSDVSCSRELHGIDRTFFSSNQADERLKKKVNSCFSSSSGSFSEWCWLFGADVAPLCLTYQKGTCSGEQVAVSPRPDHTYHNRVGKLLVCNFAKLRKIS